MSASSSRRISAEDCRAVIDEALAHTKATISRTQDCKGWRVARGSFTASIIESLGVAELDSQVVRYGPNGSYDWHTDGPTRETTMVVQLSDPADYEGGVLEFESDEGVQGVERKRGLIAEFPSSSKHRSTPVKSGERWVLVIWVPLSRRGGSRRVQRG